MARLDDLITRKVFTVMAASYTGAGQISGAVCDPYWFFQTQILNEDGREQATGFQMAGEIIGMDALVAMHTLACRRT